MPWCHPRMRRIHSRRFDFSPSVAARRFVAVSHCATAALVAALPLDALMASSLMLLVAALGLRSWRGLERGLAGIVIRSDATLTALAHDGRAIDGTLAPGSSALPGYAAIVWRAEDARRSRCECVPADRLAGEAHRELRVLLRYATSGVDALAPASHARASISAALSALLWPARRWRYSGTSVSGSGSLLRSSPGWVRPRIGERIGPGTIALTRIVGRDSHSSASSRASAATPALVTPYPPQ